MSKSKFVSLDEAIASGLIDGVKKVKPKATPKAIIRLKSGDVIPAPDGITFTLTRSEEDRRESERAIGLKFVETKSSRII
jgi:hypothetical protein